MLILNCYLYIILPVPEATSNYVFDNINSNIDVCWQNRNG